MQLIRAPDCGRHMHVKITIPHSPTKMKELILHIATACAADEKCGAVKLNKILFYADFLAYYRRGKSITGQPYFAIKDGPAPQQFIPIRESMIEEKAIAIQKLEVGMASPMTRVVPLRPPNYSKLEAEDIAIVDFVISKLKSMNGAEVSAMSHRFKGWKAAFDNGAKTKIPYASVLFDPAGFWDIKLPDLPETQVKHGHALWNKINAA